MPKTTHRTPRFVSMKPASLKFTGIHEGHKVTLEVKPNGPAKHPERIHLMNVRQKFGKKTGVVRARRIMGPEVKPEKPAGLIAGGKGEAAAMITRDQIIEKLQLAGLKNPSQQLDKGIEVELEHTDSRKKAMEIAGDHLSEIPDYYDRLVKLEKSAENSPLTRRIKVLAEVDPAYIESSLINNPEAEKSLIKQYDAALTNLINIRESKSDARGGLLADSVIQRLKSVKNDLNAWNDAIEFNGEVKFDATEKDFKRKGETIKILKDVLNVADDVSKISEKFKKLNPNVRGLRINVPSADELTMR
jgi:hypothetical protein